MPKPNWTDRTETGPEREKERESQREWRDWKVELVEIMENFTPQREGVKEDRKSPNFSENTQTTLCQNESKFDSKYITLSYTHSRGIV